MESSSKSNVLHLNRHKLLEPKSILPWIPGQIQTLFFPIPARTLGTERISETWECKEYLYFSVW